MSRRILLVLLVTLILKGPATRGVEGGLRLTGRTLVAVPRDDPKVFLSWRFLQQDGPAAAFEVQQSATAGQGFVKVAVVWDTTTFLDAPGAGVHYYRVLSTVGALQNNSRHFPFVAKTDKENFHDAPSCSVSVGG